MSVKLSSPLVRRKLLFQNQPQTRQSQTTSPSPNPTNSNYEYQWRKGLSSSPFCSRFRPIMAPGITQRHPLSIGPPKYKTTTTVSQRLWKLSKRGMIQPLLQSHRAFSSGKEVKTPAISVLTFKPGSIASTCPASAFVS
jgi:hypothetical protein